MKYFFDTEFLEDGSTIDLISIGIVSEDGREYYACCRDADWNRIVKDPWLKENVLPQLSSNNSDWKSKIEIRKEIVEFVGKNPEFWADYASYDWVVLCQLFGRMIDLPDTWPMFCHDVQQLAQEKGIRKFPESKGEHNALADAKNTKERYHLAMEC